MPIEPIDANWDFDVSRIGHTHSFVTMSKYQRIQDEFFQQDTSRHEHYQEQWNETNDRAEHTAVTSFW